MPAISSSTIFTNMRVPNFAALKTKSVDAASASPNKSKQIYLRRLQKEEMHKQPQLFIYGHPAVAPRCAILRNAASTDAAFGTLTPPFTPGEGVWSCQVLARQFLSHSTM
ncbi:hypothetical protein BJ742DRAFT_780771 [Cladochytrium replicatum]|nr:hypothetical protein BJ742DRAFT_780771 [Cladochytrium replicatum]